MSSLLIEPYEGQIFGASSIDKAGTRVHEDLLKITRRNGMTQIDVACLAAPTEYVPESEILRALTRDLYAKKDADPTLFLPQKERVAFSLNEATAQPVLVATYLLDDTYDLIFEELSLSSAVVTLKNSREFSKKEECLHAIKELLKVMRHKPSLDGYAKMWHEKKFGADWMPADYMITMALQLFNMTCRNSARRKNIFFMEKSYLGEYYLKAFGSYAVFNRVLRDSVAFVNASNLTNYFLSLPIVYTQKFLKKNLPEGRLVK